MVELNLLFSRTDQLTYENTILRRYLLAGLFIALVMLVGSHVWLLTINQHKQDALNISRQSIVADVTKDSGAIEENDFSAATVIRLLTRTMASKLQGVCYTVLSRDAAQIHLQGNAWTMAGISATMNQISVSGQLAELYLLNLKRQPGSELLQFTLDAREA